MALDHKFYKLVQELHAPGMGTENVGQLLYSLVRMTRSWRLMEVGLGFTTPFMAQALKDAAEDFVADRQTADPTRRSELDVNYYMQNYSAVLHAIDDYSLEGTSAPKVLDVLTKLGLDGLVNVYNGDFRGMSRQIEPASFPLDLVWFDCGGIPEYVDFLNEYWPLINPDGGMLLLHFTYWDMGEIGKAKMVMGSIANEIKRQHAKAGLDADFEVLTLVEPHKIRQGSVTMVRRTGGASKIRDAEFEDDVNAMLGLEIKPLRKL